MKYLSLFCVFCFLSTSTFFAQELSVESTLYAFQNYTGNFPVEKIYLHLDKPYYAAGETMYFRAYLTDVNLNPENVASRIIYVELSDAKKLLVKRLLLYSEQSEFAGQMLLPDSLPSANYHLRAYTNWMRNAGEDYFYHRDIYIGNTGEPKPATTSPRTFDYQAAFFPEGGQLIAGSMNKVAFKALGNDGLGADISGILSDPDGKEILRFNSTHLGMGSFNFIPEKGKVYKATVQSNGISKEYTLPVATQGLALSARQNEKSIYLAIRSSGDDPGALYLVGQARDSICYAVQRLKGSVGGMFSVDKDKFPTGIAQFTLFKNGKPVSERLLFIDRKEDLQASLIPGKENYGDREKATLRIKVSDKDGQPVQGSFSLSVTNDKIVIPSIREQNIKGSLLLAADLKGNIESPGWYFAGNEPERTEALDNLLCTQGWTRFVWAQLSSPPADTKIYPVESEFQITGKVTNLIGKPVQNTAVNFLSKENLPGTITTDENGRFGFYGFNCPEGASFVLQCQDKNSRKGIIGLKIDAPDNRQAPTGIIPSASEENKRNQALIEEYMKQAGRVKDEYVKEIRTVRLPEVKVETTKTTDQRSIGVRSYHYGENKLNRKIFITNILQSLPLPTHGPYSFNAIPPPIWYIVDDGMRMDWDTFSSTYGSWYASSFESVDILSAEDAVGLHGLDFSRGAYILKTKKITKGNDIPDASVQVVRPEGYSVRKEFYVPAYDNPEVKNDPTPDLRTTIYWNPAIHTDKAGEAEVGFFTADGTGTYSYVLEGIGDRKVVFANSH